MARQKMISTSKLAEIIDLMKAKGVSKLTIPETVMLELYPFAVDSGALPQEMNIESSHDLGDNEMSDKELLLHSAN